MFLRTLLFKEFISLHKGREVCSSHFTSCLFQNRDRYTCNNLYSNRQGYSISRSNKVLVLFYCFHCIYAQLSISLPPGSFKLLLTWNLHSQEPFDQAENECRLEPNMQLVNREGNWIEVTYESSHTYVPTLLDTDSFSRSTIFLLFSCQSGQ